MDFLATVAAYPKPDEKIRSTSLKVRFNLHFTGRVWGYTGLSVGDYPYFCERLFLWGFTNFLLRKIETSSDIGVVQME